VERDTVIAKYPITINTTQCPKPGLEPGLLNLETSALTMIPPHLLKWNGILKRTDSIDYNVKRLQKKQGILLK